jgi:hypothetical protein
MMITILVGFFDKKTEIIAHQEKINVPYDIVLAAAAEDEYTGNELSEAMAEGKQIDYINCRPFGVTEEMKNYIIEHYPEMKEKFEKYIFEFIGRHGLGPEYD